MQRRRQPLHHVATFVNLASLNGCVPPKGAPDRLGKRLRTVDDEQPRPRWIDASLNQVVDQCLHHRGILGGTFHEPERMLDALTVDTNGGHQHQVLGNLHAIDLYDQEIEPGKIRLHKALHALARQRHKMSRCRGLRRPGSRWCRNIALRKPYRPTEFPRRDIDEHQIHRPLPEPVLPPCLLPARQRDLLAAELTNPRPFDVDLAAMEANLPLRVPPAIPAPALSTRVARPAKFLSLLLHHRRKRLEAGRQAEPLEAGRYLIPRLTHTPPIYRHSIVQRLLKSLRNKAANKLFTPPGAVTTATLSPGSVDGSSYRGPDPSTALSPARASKALTQYGSVDLGSSATTAIR